MPTLCIPKHAAAIFGARFDQKILCPHAATLQFEHVDQIAHVIASQSPRPDVVVLQEPDYNMLATYLEPSTGTIRTRAWLARWMMPGALRPRR